MHLKNDEMYIDCDPVAVLDKKYRMVWPVIAVKNLKILDTAINHQRQLIFSFLD